MLPFEVGAKGYPATSFMQMLRVLGLSKHIRDEVMSACSQVALRASYIIYLHREHPVWPALHPFVSEPVKAASQ